MRLALRPYDRIGRYGGEEFLVIAPGCDWNRIVALAERIRDAIGAEAITSQSAQIPMTVSLGLTIGCGQGEDAGTLIAAADEALYRAKKAGRNRVECSDPQYVQISQDARL